MTEYHIFDFNSEDSLKIIFIINYNSIAESNMYSIKSKVDKKIVG